MLNYFKAFVMYPVAESLLKRDIRSKLIKLREFEKIADADKIEAQKKQIYLVVNEAYQHVPYYNELFKKINFNPENLLKSTEYLNEIPVLTKEILREQGSRMLNSKIDPKKLIVKKTNGSTGIVTEVFYDTEALDWTAAANLYASELSGCTLLQKQVHLSSENNPNAEIKEKIVNNLKCYCLNREILNTKFYDEATLLEILIQIKNIKPHSIQGHASTLYHLALEAQKHGEQFKNLFQFFESTGESIEKIKADLIEKTFTCKVLNRYGSAEFGVIAKSSQNFEELKIINPIAYVESHSLGNGLDELVVTGLTNFAMPLLRYKTGDIGTVENYPNKSVIKKLHGRLHDIIDIQNKSYSTNYFRYIFDNLGGVDEFQIIKKDSQNDYTIKIVASEKCNKTEVEKVILNEFQNAMRIEWSNFNDLILTGWRDKFRHFVRIK